MFATQSILEATHVHSMRWRHHTAEDRSDQEYSWFVSRAMCRTPKTGGISQCFFSVKNPCYHVAVFSLGRSMLSLPRAAGEALQSILAYEVSHGPFEWDEKLVGPPIFGSLGASRCPCWCWRCLQAQLHSRSGESLQNCLLAVLNISEPT